MLCDVCISILKYYCYYVHSNEDLKIDSQFNHINPVMHVEHES